MIIHYYIIVAIGKAILSWALEEVHMKTVCDLKKVW